MWDEKIGKENALVDINEFKQSVAETNFSFVSYSRRALIKQKASTGGCRTSVIVS